MKSLRDREIASVEDAFDKAIGDRWLMIGNIPSDEKSFDARFAEALVELETDRIRALAEIDKRHPAEGDANV